MTVFVARTQSVHDIHNEVLSTPILQALIHNPYM